VINGELAPDPAGALAHLALLVVAAAGATAVRTDPPVGVDFHTTQAVADDQRNVPSKNGEFASSRCRDRHGVPTLVS